MNKFLLPGAIALILVASPMLSAQARPGNSTGNRTEHRHAQGQKEQFGERLGLTDAQKQAMKSIREAVQKDVYNTVLTPDQRTEYDAAVQRGEQPGRIMRSLKLTDAQKNSIRDKMKAAREKINQEVLTQAQRDQIQQMRQQRGNRQGA